MPVRLGVEGRIELRHFWEETSHGSSLPFRERETLRACLASLRGRATDVWALRRFLHASAPGRTPPHDDHELFDRVTEAVIRGDLRASIAPIDALYSIGNLEEEQPRDPIVSERVDAPAVEEVCMPCQRAAASARALRDAAAGGTPFIAEM